MTDTTCTRHQEQSLFDMRQGELEELFSSLPSQPLPEQALSGRLFAVSGLGWLPRPGKRGLYNLLASPLNPWKGKRFSGPHGANLWFGLDGAAFGRYRVEERLSDDGNPCVQFNYNVEENPKVLRAIRGEARHLQPGLWLCRMLWSHGQQKSVLLWFTLSTDAHEAHHND